LVLAVRVLHAHKIKCVDCVKIFLYSFVHIYTIITLLILTQPLNVEHFISPEMVVQGNNGYHILLLPLLDMAWWIYLP